MIELSWNSAALFAAAKDWQALIGAAIALPLTFLAIIVPWRLERRKYKRRVAAMRASMPLRLAQVSTYSVSAMKSLAEARRNVGSPGVRFEKPDLPEQLVDGLERTIEAIAEGRVVDRLSNMIGEIQVLESRMSGIDIENESEANIDSHLVRAAVVYAQSASLFDYARRRASGTSARIKWGEIKTSFLIAKVYEVQHPDLYAFVDRLSERGADPEDSDPRMSRWLRFRLWWSLMKERIQEKRKALSVT